MSLKEKIKMGLAIAGATGLLGTYILAYDARSRLDNSVNLTVQSLNYDKKQSDFAEKEIDRQFDTVEKETNYGYKLWLASIAAMAPYGLSLLKKNKKKEN